MCAPVARGTGLTLMSDGIDESAGRTLVALITLVTLVALAPAAPLVPLVPSAPGSPLSPLAPGAPLVPLVPFVPLVPSSPGSPLSPLAPGAPLLPLVPSSPAPLAALWPPAAPLLPWFLSPGSPLSPLAPAAPSRRRRPSGPLGPWCSGRSPSPPALGACRVVPAQACRFLDGSPESLRTRNSPFALSGTSMPARGVFDTPILSVFALPADLAKAHNLRCDCWAACGNSTPTMTATIRSAALSQ